MPRKLTISLLLLPLFLGITFAQQVVVLKRYDSPSPPVSNPVSSAVPPYKDIFEAAEKGTADDVRFYIDRGENVNTKNHFEQTPIYSAVSRNPDAGVLKLLIARGADPNSEDNYGLLNAAAFSNPNAEILEILLDHGADVNARIAWVGTPLHSAAEHNPNVDVLKTLLARGADVNAQNSQGATPLFIADTPEKEAILREAGGQMMFLDILAAARRGTIDDIRDFIARGEDVNTKSEQWEGDTPLHHAARYNPDINVLKFLLEQGADVDAKDWMGETPLFAAAIRKSGVDYLKLLVEHGADVGVKSSWQQTPLHSAVEYNSDIDVLKFLLGQGMDVREADWNGDTPFSLAIARNPNADYVKILIEHGADVNEKDNTFGTTPLHRAAERNPNVDVLKILIEHGADVNAKANAWLGKQTPLEFAGTEEKKAFLIAAGAEATLRDMFDAAAKITAADIRTFVDRGGDISTTDNGVLTPFYVNTSIGLTLLHLVAEKNPDVDTLNALIAQGADVSARDPLGATPLHYAAWKNTNPAILKYLVAQGADINAQADNGWTPLHSAAVGTSPAAILKTLIELGADVNAKTDEGSTPIDYTESEEKKTILIDAGGKSAWL